MWMAVDTGVDEITQGENTEEEGQAEAQEGPADTKK